MWGMDTTMEARRFARLFGGRKWIVENRNSRDCMELGRIVKVRRRQSVNLRPLYLCVGFNGCGFMMGSGIQLANFTWR